ncbi:hypothetical protein BDY19DRAFT_891709 [Irpex rosettiformis]|uniref:Uncharacterized protein n=1 Tax=Irpex rosettiformis TaxID=378272 RepID=A0ACB8U1P8_9APHY|nr:hypothetical protein BDY19DRAFT_891709 [Irpex rosettiformis]
MVASVGNDLYSPFPPNLAIEDGVQSSEEGSTSDVHSPVFEVPFPANVRYHLNHQLQVADAATPLVPASFDARYSAQHLNVHSPPPHLLGTLQVPSPTAMQHLLPPPHSHVAYARAQHPMLDLGMEPPSLLHSPTALSPAEEYFNLPQSGGLPEQHMPRASYSAMPSTTQGSIVMAPPDQKPQPPLQASPSGKSSAAGSSPATSSPAGPSRPRREASTVVIACRQCRARKIRCDSTRPVCNNCTRRGNDCEYDAVPKRRGPDKRPGTRQRSCKKRPSEGDPSSPGANILARKRRKVEDDHDSNLVSFELKDSLVNGAKRNLFIQKTEETSIAHLPQAPSHVLETSMSARGIASEAIYPKVKYPVSFISRGTWSTTPRHTPFHAFSNTMPQEDDRQLQLFSTPSIDYSRRTWWDNLLNTYAPTPQESSVSSPIFNDLDFLISESSYWLFFINRQTFFQNLRDNNRRSLIQPSLVLSALAMANLMQSSELERGAHGRNCALRLRDNAQASLEAACNANSLDFTLAEAALILALFESSCHPQYSTQRAESSLQFVDRIIRALSLSMIDVEDPDVCMFSPDSPPVVCIPDYQTPQSCDCTSALATNGIFGEDRNSLFQPSSLPWDEEFPEEMRKEECRRICWSALNLIASYTAQCAAFHQEPMELYLTDAVNYAILFPGEAYARTGRNSERNQVAHVSSKESVWALYCRSMLLWTSCIRQRDSTWETEARADFAIAAWVETRAIQDALDMHRCNGDTALIYMCREYIYNTRMTITYELRRRLQDIDDVRPPMFNRRQAEEWLYYQSQVAKRVMDSVKGLSERPGHLLSRRPFQSLWYSSQVSICLALWNYDHDLFQALELAKSFLIPLDTLNVLWPCQVQNTRCQELRIRLTDACNTVRIPIPLPATVSLPLVLQHLV